MEAMNGSQAPTCGRFSWHCNSVRNLHHKFGYMFRSAPRDLGWCQAWIQGGNLAKDVARWTKELDAHYAKECDSKPKALCAHVSDSTAAPFKDLVVKTKACIHWTFFVSHLVHIHFLTLKDGAGRFKLWSCFVD